MNNNNKIYILFIFNIYFCYLLNIKSLLNSKNNLFKIKEKEKIRK